MLGLLDVKAEGLKLIDEIKIDVILDYNRNSCIFQFVKNNKGNRSTKTRPISRSLGQGSFSIYRYRSLDERSRTPAFTSIKKEELPQNLC